MAELTDVKGVSDSRADDLRDEGFTTVDDVATATADELSSVSGIGTSTAEDLIESAQNVIRDDTLDSSEEGQTQEQDEEEAEVEDDPSQTETDLNELVEDQPVGTTMDDVNTEDDEDEREVEVTPKPPFDIELVVETDTQYDALYYAMVSLRLGNFHVNGPQNDIADEVISQLRPVDGAVTVTLSLDTGALNALSAGLQQVEVSVQGLLYNDPYESLQELREQVDAQREEFLG